MTSQAIIAAFNTEALKLSVMGVTITISSGYYYLVLFYFHNSFVGDNGAADKASNMCSCPGTSVYGYYNSTGYNPSFPATSPYVTGILFFTY